MNIDVLTSVLLFALSVPVVMGYRILPVTGTPYWLFGLLFFLFIGNIWLSLTAKLDKGFMIRVRKLILVIVLTVVVGGTTITAIVDRQKTAPIYGVHDIVLQQEAAMRYLLSGKNPYRETYFDTPVVQFNYDEPGNPNAVNPALYHFVMPPWYILFPLGIYGVSIPLLGYFDGRMALLITLLGLLVVIWKWFANKSLASLAVVLTALSPAVVDFFIEGRSDTFALFWFIWALYFADRRCLLLSGAIFGLALLSKQTIWFATPFYLTYLWFSYKSTNIMRPHNFGGAVAAMMCVLIVVVGPFLFWDSAAFINSTIRYLSGSTQYGYPVSGYGLGVVLGDLGIIRDIHEYYPFILWQAVFGIPLLWRLFGWIKRKPVQSRVILAYALFLSVIWYMSRYFNNSHWGYLSQLFILGALKAQDESGV